MTTPLNDQLNADLALLSALQYMQISRLIYHSVFRNPGLTVWSNPS